MLTWADDRIRVTHSLALPGPEKVTGIEVLGGKSTSKKGGITSLQLYKDNGMNNFFDISFKSVMKDLKTYATLDYVYNPHPYLYSSWTFETINDWNNF